MTTYTQSGTLYFFIQTFSAGLNIFLNYLLLN